MKSLVANNELSDEDDIKCHNKSSHVDFTNKTIQRFETKKILVYFWWF